MKGLSFEKFETFVSELAPFGYAVKCYMMQKPVLGIADEEAVRDIWQAIDYFANIARLILQMSHALHCMQREKAYLSSSDSLTKALLRQGVLSSAMATLK